MKMNLYLSVNWKDIRNFSPNEFPENPELYAEPELIYTLQDLRDLYSKRIYPSPAPGALARFDGSEESQHFVGPDGKLRKSTGVDVFVEGCPFEFYSSILKIQNIKGIGIYLDTKWIDGNPRVMFHIDIRRKGYNNAMPLIWIAKKENGIRKYFYPQIDNSKYKLLSNNFFN